MSHWADGYLGLRHVSRGRDRAGLDCWGLVRLIYAEVKGIALPSYAGEYACASELVEVDRVLAGADGPPWTPVLRAREFDILAFRVGAYRAHVGICAVPGRFLHVHEGDLSKITRMDDPIWAKRCLGVWRHEALV